ncbi:hypothetical protein WN943_006695 [Citrus x changshan-huyou]
MFSSTSSDYSSSFPPLDTHSGSLFGGAVNITGAKRKFDSLASPVKTITSPLSPHHSSTSKMVVTPVSIAMTTAKWLRTIICPLPSKPSAELDDS